MSYFCSEFYNLKNAVQGSNIQLKRCMSEKVMYKLNKKILVIFNFMKYIILRFNSPAKIPVSLFS